MKNPNLARRDSQSRTLLCIALTGLAKQANDDGKIQCFDLVAIFSQVLF